MASPVERRARRAVGLHVGLATLLVMGLLIFPGPRPARADTLGQPAVTLELPGAASIGASVTVPVTFDNPAADAVGYGPYVVLCLPATGADGAGAGDDDGLTFTGATYLGASLTALPVTLGPESTAVHPLTGQTISCPAESGWKEGDQAVVVPLPFGSFTAGQPPATIQVTLALSNLADLGAPLTVGALGGYRFGDTPTGDNGPVPAATLSPSTAAELRPTVYSLAKAYLGPENETATGPNFPRRYRIVASVAPGQTVTDLEITDTLPPTLQFAAVTSTTPAGAETTTPPADSPGGTFTTRFASVTGTGGADAVVEFEAFVPENGATPETSPVLDPQTGAQRSGPATTNAASSTGVWQPIDERDDSTQAAAESEAPHTLDEQSLAIQKSVKIVDDIGATGASPGDTLEWTLSFQISDFFIFDELVVDDRLSDGQTVVPDSASLTVSEAPASDVDGAVPAGRFAISTLDCPPAPSAAPPDRTAITVDLSGALVDLGAPNGILAGGRTTPLLEEGPTTGTLRFRTTIDEAYTCATPSGNGVLDPADPLANAASLTGRVLDDLLSPTGSTVSDDTGAGIQMVTGTLSKSVYALNGDVLDGPPATIQIAPGDQVTYRIEATLPLTSMENLAYHDYLPLPVFHASELTAFDGITDAAPPAAGRAKYGPTNTFEPDGGGPPVMATDAGSNRVSFSYGTRDTSGTEPAKADLLLTVTATDEPYADGLFLTNQVRETQNNSFSTPTAADAIVQVERTEPVLTLTKGVVATSRTAGVSFAPADPGGGVTWNAPGAGAAFSGTLTSDGLAADPVNSNVSGLDAGDLVRFAIVVDNQGASRLGAFDVRLRDSRPAGLVDPPDGIGLTVTNGAGAPLGHTEIGGGLFDPDGGIELTDGAGVGAVGIDSPSSGADIVVVSYSLLLPSPATAFADELDNTAALVGYSGNDAGPNYAPTPLTDTARVSTVTPAVAKTLTGTSEPSSVNADVVIGEHVSYRVVVTVPEGTATNARLTDTMNSGLALVQVDAITASPGLATSVTEGFTGVLDGATVEGAGRTFSLDFGTLTNSDTDDSVTETLTVDLTAVVINATGNDAGQTRRNAARFTATGVDVSVNAPPVTIREPALTTTVSVDPTTAEAGRVVTYTITVTAAGSSNATAFDAVLANAIPAGVTYVDGTAAHTGAGVVPANLAVTGGILNATWTTLAPGQTSTITFQATVNRELTHPLIVDTADVAWTSLPGDRTTTSSTHNATAVERTGDTNDLGGNLNDHLASGSATLTIPAGVTKTLVSTSYADTAGADLTIGETGTYRIEVTLPQGTLPDGFTVTDSLPPGLAYVGGTAAVDPAGFDGTLGAHTVSPAGDGTSGDDVVLTFGSTTATVDDNPADNTFAVTLTARVLDVPGNVGVAPPGRTPLVNSAVVRLGTDGPPVTSTPVTVTVAEPRLAVTKSMPATATVGDTVEVTITVTNTGTSPAWSPTVSDPLDGAFFTTVTPGPAPAGWVASVAGTTVTFADDPGDGAEVRLDPGQQVTFTLSGVVGGGVASNQEVTNTATASGATTLPGADQGERTAPDAAGSAVTKALTPDLTVTIDDGLTTVSPGQTLTYTITVGNIGGEAAPNTVLSDTLPPGTTFVSASGDGIFSGGEVTFPPFTAEPGSSRTFTVTVTVDKPTGAATLDHPATVAYDGTRGVDPPANNTDDDVDVVSPDDASIAGAVYVDADDDGVRDPGEAAIPGVPVRLTGTDVNGQPVDATVQTGPDGTYTFTDLVAGTYTVTETQPAEWNDGKDTAGSAAGTAGADTISSIALGASQAATGYLFGERGAAISGTVFLDADRDGTRDDGADMPIPGITVTLLDADGTTVVAQAITGADGTYRFPDLPAGDYTVREEHPVGYGSSPSSSDRRAVTLPLAGLDGVDFADTLSTLSGSVYYDRDEDGTRDAGEPGIGAVTVRLTGTDDAGTAVDLSTSTAGDGSWSFTGLRSGTYTVTETQPLAWNDGQDTPGGFGGTLEADQVSGIAVPAGEDGPGYDFGELGAPIAGTVWVDLDRNASLDNDEPGLGGTTLTLLGGNDEVVATTTSQADGSFSFPNIPTGTYTVRETQPAGYGSSTDDIRTVTVGTDGATGVVFGETLSTLSGSVYVDLDDDGVRDAGEPPIPGVTVTLAGTDANGESVAAETVTDSDGNWIFTRLLGGTYTVTETQPAQWNDGKDAAGPTGGTVAADSVGDIPLPAGDDAPGYLFGELGTTLTGRVFVDLDRSGTPDDGEDGLSGVTVTLLDAGGNEVGTTETGPDGSYRFEDLPAGTYRVEQTQPTGYGSSTDNDVEVDVPLAGLAGVDFGETLSSLAGSVYLDRNDDGNRNDGEEGLAGVTVRLTGTDATGADVTRETTTGPDGGYRFDGLLAGTYTVTEAQPAEWNDGKDTAGSAGGTPAAPGGDTLDEVDLPPGTDAAGYLFGERGATLAGTVYVDTDRDGARHAGEAGLPGVTVALLDADGDEIATTVTGDDGRYSFPHLPAGTYTVAERHPAGYGSSTPDSLPAELPLAGLDGLDFGETVSTLAGFVYVDADDDGVRDDGEDPIPGVTVTLTGTDATGAHVRRTATTGADGSFSFTGLLAGSYTLTQSHPDAWKDGKDTAGQLVRGAAGADRLGRSADDRITDIDLPAGADAAGHLFGERPTADLVLAKTTADRTSPAGQVVTYVLTVTNQGPSVAAGPIVVTDDLPAGLTFAAAGGAGWDCSAAGPKVTCTRPEPLAVGEAAPPVSVDTVLDADASGSVRNTARAATPTAEVHVAGNSATRMVDVLRPADLNPLRPAPPDSALPVTGSDSNRAVTAGLGLTQFGLVLLGLSRLRRRRS